MESDKIINVRMEKYNKKTDRAYFTYSPITVLQLQKCVKWNLGENTKFNLTHFRSYRCLTRDYVKCVLFLSNFISPSYIS